MIRRTSRSAQTLHLLHEEWYQRARVLYPRLSLLIEVSLVGRATTLYHAEEAVFHSLCSLYVYLSRQVATGVHLVIHVERRILRVAQVVLSICVIHTLCQRLFVLKARPYLLTLLGMNDCCTCILTERQLALASHLSITQHGECYVLIVIRSIRCSKY